MRRGKCGDFLKLKRETTRKQWNYYSQTDVNNPTF